MRILTLSDIHNDVENIMKFLDKLLTFNFDVIVAIGDFVDVNIPKGFSEEDVGRLILEELKTLKKPILAVPGNFDKKLIPLFKKEGICLHGDGKIIGDVGFYGFGGAITPFETPLEVTEEEIENGLKQGYEKVKEARFKVQITHIPPYRTQLDMILSGSHVGSKKVREFIEEYQPHVAVCAHIHEGRGVDQIGKTKIINSGRFPEGYCGLIAIEEKNIDVKIINLM